MSFLGWIFTHLPGPSGLGKVVDLIHLHGRKFPGHLDPWDRDAHALAFAEYFPDVPIDKSEFMEAWRCYAYNQFTSSDRRDEAKAKRKVRQAAKVYTGPLTEIGTPCTRPLSFGVYMRFRWGGRDTWIRHHEKGFAGVYVRADFERVLSRLSPDPVFVAHTWGAWRRYEIYLRNRRRRFNPSFYGANRFVTPQPKGFTPRPTMDGECAPRIEGDCYFSYVQDPDRWAGLAAVTSWEDDERRGYEGVMSSPSMHMHM